MRFFELVRDPLLLVAGMVPGMVPGPGGPRPGGPGWGRGGMGPGEQTCFIDYLEFFY